MDEYSIKYFSISLPKGSGQHDVAALLSHTSQAIKEMGNIEIQDMAFSSEIDEDGNEWPSFTVYYHSSKTD